ncbi:hypothetical protein [Niallia sp. FSL R7-0271]
MKQEQRIMFVKLMRCDKPIERRIFMLKLGLRILDRLGTKENITFGSVYIALGCIYKLEEQILYVRKFAEIDPDYVITLRKYVERESRRTGDMEIAKGWYKAISIVDSENDEN